MQATELPAWVQILIAVGGTLGTALIALLGKVLDRWADTIAERHKLAFISRIDDHVMGYVTDLFNTEIEALKAAAEDGKLTKEEKDRLKRTVVEVTKRHIGIGALSKVFGANVDTELGARVEKAVTVAKNAGKAVKLPLA